MAETQNNVGVRNLKGWDDMDPAHTATAAGSCVIADQLGNQNLALYMATNTVHYLYHHDENQYQPITSGGFAVAIAAGFCGTYHPWSVIYTANGGSTTTITVAAASFNINGNVRGKKVRLLSGTAGNIGFERTITKVANDVGIGTITMTLDSALPSPVANNDTFKVASGSFYMLNAGTLAATNYFKRFDLGTYAWSDRAVTGLPATWGTDGKMVTPAQIGVFYSSGTATSGSATTLNDTTKAWVTDQWKNYQLRITAGTGCGQVSLITTNSPTQVTIASGATLDNTSQYVIEGDENAIYIMGNNAVTLYKNSISGNTTTTVTVTAARAAQPVAGMSADFVGVTGIEDWGAKDGRYIYCLRGGSAIIDRYDITTLAWLPTTGVNYLPASVTFATGDSTFWSGRYIYIAKEGSATVAQRFYKFALRGNYTEPVATDYKLGGAALLGNKIWVKNLSSEGVVKYLYCLQSTSTALRRIMLF